MNYIISLILFIIFIESNLNSEYELTTNDNAFATNLVEGEQVEIISENKRSIKLSYLESMLIPAASGKIKIINKGNRTCKMVMVFIKPEIGISAQMNNPTL